MSSPPPQPSAAAREAMRRAAAELDAAEAQGQPHAMSHALAQVARCYRAVDALAAAESGFELALRWARLSGSTDACAALLVEMAETAAALGLTLQADGEPGAARAARERARDHVFEASTLAPRCADPGWEAPLLLRLSDVLDRCGDHDDACALQTRALRLMNGKLGPADARQLPSLGRLADG